MTEAQVGIAIFGGTFDPVHLGHIESAHELKERLNVRAVHMVAANVPPHRSRPGSTPTHRLAMLALATASKPGLIADDRELKRSGNSYTVDTLRSFREEFGADEPLYFALGMDAFLTLPSWHQWESLGDLAHLVVLARPGYDFRPCAELGCWLEDRQVRPDALTGVSGKVCLLELTAWPVSATEIRAALGRGDEVGNQLPAGVADYIRSHHLYV